jgi:hypothetical protein
MLSRIKNNIELTAIQNIAERQRRDKYLSYVVMDEECSNPPLEAIG